MTLLRILVTIVTLVLLQGTGYRASALPSGTISFLRYFDSTRTYGLMLIDASTAFTDEAETIPFDPVVTDLPVYASPRWSPDGKSVLLIGKMGNGDIFRFDVASKALTNLTNSPSAERNAVWAPDGKQIAFESDQGKESGHTEIYVMTLSNGKMIRLTRSGSNGVSTMPVWSPDGSAIAYFFKANADAPHELHLIRPDGSRELGIGNAQSGEDHRFLSGVRWSPDSRALAYVRQNGDMAELGVLAVNTDNPTFHGLETFSLATIPDRSTLFQDHLYNFEWSPDGTRIAYDVPNGTLSAINIVTVRSGQIEALSAIRENEGTYDNRMPCWSPDGSSLLYTSLRFGQYDIYQIAVEGGEAQRVTASGWDSLLPMWGGGTYW